MPPLTNTSPGTRMAAQGTSTSGSQSNGRQTTPQNWNPYQTGIMGLVSRRGVQNPAILQDPDKLKQLALYNPLRLLTLYADVHPGLRMAESNIIRLICANDDFQVVGELASSTNAGDAATDERGTAAIEALWASQPPEMGGLSGLRATLTLMLLYTGLACVEAVPGKVGEGVRRVLPVDSLTVAFGRDDLNADLTPYQRQNWIGTLAQKVNPYGYVRLTEKDKVPTFFWRALDAMVDDPYGRPYFGSALSEVPADLRNMKNLDDALEHVAWPRLKLGFDFGFVVEQGVTLLQITDPAELSAYVWAEYEKFSESIANLGATDAIITPTSGSADEIEGGKGMGNLSESLQFKRQRQGQSFKTWPTLQGINDGSTQTYTSIEYMLYAQGVESLRGIVGELICQVADLHFRMMGLPYKAKMKYTPIRTNDELIDANTEAVKISNALKKVYLGWTTNEDACMQITGTGPSVDALPEDYPQIIGIAPEVEPVETDTTDDVPPNQPADDVNGRNLLDVSMLI